MPDARKEASDDHVYALVAFSTEMLRFLEKALSHYQNVLAEDVAAIETDSDLNLLLGEKPAEALPVQQELRRVGRVREFIRQNTPMELLPNISHGAIRFLRSVGLLYLNHLQNRRNAVAQRPRMSAHVLRAVDQRLAQLTGLLSAGVFGKATPVELMAAAEVPSVSATAIIEDRPSALPVRRPIVVSTIEILDPELQARCLDLFDQFRVDDKTDHLDTVITEATRILEDRLRRVSGASANCTGVDLSQFAFAGSPRRLLVSQVDAEQQAVHLLFRGVFGFVRNPVHHRLVGQLQPERVLQIVGMIDYLLSLIQGAQASGPKP